MGIEKVEMRPFWCRPVGFSPSDSSSILFSGAGWILLERLAGVVRLGGGLELDTSGPSETDGRLFEPSRESEVSGRAVGLDNVDSIDFSRPI